MKLSDYVFQFLYDQGVEHTFTLTGGGIMHLVDSLGNSQIDYTCCHHEQACAIAAQAYSMYREEVSICLVTTGPGGTNALTGTAAAYVDSTPVFYLSGQVKREDFAALRGVRQFGAQENDIISMAKPVTKYSVLIQEPEDIRYELEKCMYEMNTGRKGPVWMDIPLDVQGAEIEPDMLRQFETPPVLQKNFRRDALEAIHLLTEHRKPVLLVGQGAASSGAYPQIEKIARELRVPVLTTWRTMDFLGDEDELYFGAPGLQARRYSNLIIQNCDALIVLGSRLDNMITAFNEEHFAYQAEKMMVDIDQAEIDKMHLTKMRGVCGDVKEFVMAMETELSQQHKMESSFHEEWICSCNRIKEKYPILKEKQDKQEGVNLYQVTDRISRCSSAEDVIVISSTSRCNTAGHIAFQHKRGQKTISSMGMGSMGFALPSAVGAYYGAQKKRVVMIEGDGSLQLNIQELETVIANGLDIKMFIFNNQGYAAITTMQDRNFNHHYVGSNKWSGLFMPDMEQIAKAYGIPCYSIKNAEEVSSVVERTMTTEGPVICNIYGSLWFDEIPKCISMIEKATGKRVSAFLENPYPYLSQEEMEEIQNEIDTTGSR